MAAVRGAALLTPARSGALAAMPPAIPPARSRLRLVTSLLPVFLAIVTSYTDAVTQAVTAARGYPPHKTETENLKAG
jgi:hypothetical protein